MRQIRLTYSKCCAIAVAWAVVGLATPVTAQVTNWTGAVDDDYFNSGNWDNGVPNNALFEAFIDGGANQPVQIGAGPVLEVNGFQLGSVGATGGNVVQTDRQLDISPAAEIKSHVGDQGTLDSSWVMNGTAVINYGEVSTPGGNNGSDGGGLDWEIGAQLGAGGALGKHEMHDDSVMRVGDDLKIGAESNGNGEFSMDGNSRVYVGSGISVSEDASSTGVLTIAGNALAVSGNSNGPGDPDGVTDEGYLTLSSDANGSATVNIKDNGKLYIRTLQDRAGTTDVTIEGNGEMHVFETFTNAAPDLGNATLVDDISGRTSHITSNAGAKTTLTVKDNGQFSVDVDQLNSSFSGLAVSGGNNSGGNADGGESTIVIQDTASFTIQQDLHLSMGPNEQAITNVEVHGNGASVAVNGDLRILLDPSGAANPGKVNFTFDDADTGGFSTVAVAGDVTHGNVTEDGTSITVNWSNVPASGAAVSTLIGAGGNYTGQFNTVVVPHPPNEDVNTTDPEGRFTPLVYQDDAVKIGLAAPGDTDFDGVVQASTDGANLLAGIGSGGGKQWIDGDFDPTPDTIEECVEGVSG